MTYEWNRQTSYIMCSFHFLFSVKYVSNIRIFALIRLINNFPRIYKNIENKYLIQSRQITHCQIKRIKTLKNKRKTHFLSQIRLSRLIKRVPNSQNICRIYIKLWFPSNVKTIRDVNTYLRFSFFYFYVENWVVVLTNNCLLFRRFFFVSRFSDIPV